MVTVGRRAVPPGAGSHGQPRGLDTRGVEEMARSCTYDPVTERMLEGGEGKKSHANEPR